MNMYPKLIAAACVVGAGLALGACVATGPLGSSGGQNRTGASYLAEIRASNGLSPLSPDAALERAALEQAKFMAGGRRMNHTTGFGRSFDKRVRSNGIEGAAAENIAAGRFGTDELFQRWMNSSGHRRNMLNPVFSRYGLASAEPADGSGRRYWALVLAE